MANQVKLEKIVSCSSEDPDFPAKNLLTCGEVPGSWLTAREGESQATVVIQLDRKYQLNHLEIKNESSAFIEVLVADSTTTDGVKFQVLLSASSFMTPNESKNLLNINRCRVFTKDKLSPSALKQSFDLVKINCTQPFNKTIKYGVACIKFTEGDVDPNVSIPRVSLTQSPGIKTRSNEDTSKGDDNKPTPKVADPSSDESSPSPNKRLKALKMKDIDNEPSTSNHEKQTRVKPKIKKTQVDVAFCQLMNGVTFTISGFQNPLRSEIRSKGLQMGAKYKGDWDNSCTHLICAFPNTPKFNQVQATGTGKIITKEWIEDSYDNRKLLPWRKYNLDNQRKPQPNKAKNVKKRKDESDSEDDEHDSEMDDFIVGDDDDDDIEDGDEEYDPKKDKHIEDEDLDEDLDELGPVLPSKLRDDSPQIPKQLSLSPGKKVDKINTINEPSIKSKDDDSNSEAILDADTGED